jgi:hypothetical protein
MLTRRLPRDIPHAIEAIQAERCPQPEVPVGGLGDGENGALGKAIPDLPGRVRVLADVQRRIHRERTSSRYKHARQHRARQFALNCVQSRARLRSQPNRRPSDTLILSDRTDSMSQASALAWSTHVYQTSFSPNCI